MIRIEVTFRSNGAEVHRYADHVAPSLCDLARKLVAAGYADGPWQAGGLSGGSLHRLACMTVEENDTRGPRFARYQPHPRAMLHPLVVEVLARHANAGGREVAKTASSRAGGIPAPAGS